MSSLKSRGLVRIAAVLLGAVSGVASAQGLVIQRNASAGAPFSSSIWVGDMLYLSGMLAEGTVPAGAAAGTRPSITGDTYEQTLNILTNLSKALKEQGLGMGDIIQVHVYLAGDPAHEGRMDFRGMNKAYTQFFGTQEQPSKPVRAAFQVAGLAMPGALVEIEATAARPARH